MGDYDDWDDPGYGEYCYEKRVEEMDDLKAEVDRLRHVVRVLARAVVTAFGPAGELVIAEASRHPGVARDDVAGRTGEGG